MELENAGNESDAIQEEKKPVLTYKFKMPLSSIFQFHDTVSEKEIKQVIQKYLLSKKLYNKARQVVEIFK